MGGFNNPASSLKVNGTLSSPIENTYVTATAPIATQPIYVTTNNTYIINTATAANNFAFNVAASSTSTLASTLQVGQAITITYLVTNGATAYYCTGITIDGNSVTVKWQGGTAPTAGNANEIDAYTISIALNASTPTYTVLAAQTKF